MTFYVKKRGKKYRLEGRHGERLRRGSGERERLRLTLGTMNGEAAQKLHGRIDRALADGPSSLLWAELRAVLPPETFNKLAGIAAIPNAVRSRSRPTNLRNCAKRRVRTCWRS